MVKIKNIFSCLPVFLGFGSAIFILQFQPIYLNDFRFNVQVVDQQDHLLKRFSSPTGYGQWQKLKSLPPIILKMILTAEDHRFYGHAGFDPLALLRAFKQNLQHGSIVSGASTIPQQLVRIINGRSSRNVFYKFYEIVHAVHLSWRYKKNRLLEVYLNTVPMPYNSRGLFAAAIQVFKKDISLLNYAEAALLTILIRRNVQQRNQMLWRMRILLGRMGLSVNQRQLYKTVNEFLNVLPDAVGLGHALHFGYWIKQKYPLVHGKLQTYLSMQWQQNIHQIIHKELAGLREFGATNAAVVVLQLNHDQNKLLLKAMLGSKGFYLGNDGQINGAVAIRHAGSTLKPFIYGYAMDHFKLRPYSLVQDANGLFSLPDGGSYQVQNNDLKYWGWITMHEALANSRNIPAVRMAQKIGVSKLYKFFKSIGFDYLRQGPAHYGLSLALGVGGARLLHLTQLYAALANQGQMLPILIGINQGIPIYYGAKKRIISKDSAYRLTYILSNKEMRRSAFGERNFLDFPFEVAAKTGTSKDHRDSWTMGYTSDYIVGVWVGNFSGEAMQHVSGSQGAARIFHQIMRFLVHSRHQFVYPEDWQRLDLCKDTGTLKNEKCLTYTEIISSQEKKILLKQDNSSRQHEFVGVRQKIKVIEPAMGARYLIRYDRGRQSLALPLEISGLRQTMPGYFWQIDKENKRSLNLNTNRLNLDLEKGRHTFRIWYKGALFEEVVFFVE